MTVNPGSVKTSILVPISAALTNVINETPDVKTFRVKIDNPKHREEFTYKPGQFTELSILGVGESTISITSTPTRPDYLEFSIKRIGLVTEAIHTLVSGDKIALRGPYGNGFPVERWKGKNLIFVAGGIGLAPLRSVINYVLDRRGDYGRIKLIYGARSPEDLVFRWEYDTWAQAKDFDIEITVDSASDGWMGRVGFVPALLKEVKPQVKDAIALTCGPPVMIKFVLQDLVSMGFKPDQIVTTLESKMQCGVGQCGRCNIGPKYICKDGPVFTLAELNKIKGDF